MGTRIGGWGWVFLAIGIATLANAAWMLLDPGGWYADLPAGVPDFGPLNVHFVRDIGCAFATVGIALVWAANAPRWQLPLVGVAMVFFSAHALLHVWDTWRGAVDVHHLLLDLPGVYLPPLILAFALWAMTRGEAAGHSNPTEDGGQR